MKNRFPNEGKTKNRDVFSGLSNIAGDFSLRHIQGILGHASSTTTELIVPLLSIPHRLRSVIKHLNPMFNGQLGSTLQLKHAADIGCRD